MRRSKYRGVFCYGPKRLPSRTEDIRFSTVCKTIQHAAAPDPATFNFKLLIAKITITLSITGEICPLKNRASMKIATAPVNWNNADAPDFREWFPYPQILDLMVAAGYQATERGMNMPSHVSQMLTDLNERQLQLLGGFVALELQTFLEALLDELGIEQTQAELSNATPAKGSVKR
jgi:hypothetical protein